MNRKKKEKKRKRKRKEKSPISNKEGRRKFF